MLLMLKTLQEKPSNFSKNATETRRTQKLTFPDHQFVRHLTYIFLFHLNKQLKRQEHAIYFIHTEILYETAKLKQTPIFKSVKDGLV
jgi:hypothetical protein